VVAFIQSQSEILKLRARHLRAAPNDYAQARRLSAFGAEAGTHAAQQLIIDYPEDNMKNA
jgi:hypothetical protein